MALLFCLMQDELETVPHCLNLSISVRNIDQTWTGGKSLLQLASVALRYAEQVISGRIFCCRFLGDIHFKIATTIIIR
jgi:hypothetical protein